MSDQVGYPEDRFSHDAAQIILQVCNGEVDMAIGGDQGGSIRAPASLCGLVGLKPTWGLVPCTGSMGVETTIDHVGPITRTVKDCALFLQVGTKYHRLILKKKFL